MKKLFSVFAVLLVLSAFVSPFGVAAEDVTEKAGSVSISLSYGENALSGLDIAIYKIADATGDENNLRFAYTEAYAEHETPISSLQTAESRDALVEYTDNKAISPTDRKKADENGKIIFEELGIGIYLIRQAAPYNGYSELLPFLITIPKAESGESIYDIDATPKAEIEKLTDITVKKVWNDTKDTHSAISVVLKKNGAVIGDIIELNGGNNWTYTWKNIPQSDGYTVEEVDIPEGYSASVKNNGNEFIITNTDKLAQTGRNKLIAPIMGACGFVLFIIGAVINKGEKKND